MVEIDPKQGLLLGKNAIEKTIGSIEKITTLVLELMKGVEEVKREMIIHLGTINKKINYQEFPKQERMK